MKSKQKTPTFNWMLLKQKHRNRELFPHVVRLSDCGSASVRPNSHTVAVQKAPNMLFMVWRCDEYDYRHTDKLNQILLTTCTINNRLLLSTRANVVYQAVVGGSIPAPPGNMSVLGKNHGQQFVNVCVNVYTVYTMLFNENIILM